MATDKYGLTRADHELLRGFQENRCAICTKRFTVARPPNTDHRHRDGHVRGLLCGSCNTLLGLLHDNAEWMRQAADYLTNPPAARLFDEPRRHRDAPPEAPR